MRLSSSLLAAVLVADVLAQTQRPSASGTYPTGEGEARARLRDREQAQRQRELYADTPAPRLTRQQRRALERAGKPLPAEAQPESRHKPDKGRKGGSCNREACQRPGATWFNSSTRAWYCPECAEKINYWSMRDDGVVLCTPEGEL